MYLLDSRITDYLFWLKFVWSVWSELRATRIPVLDASIVPVSTDNASGIG